MSKTKDPKVDTSSMSKEDAQNYYVDNAKARQLIRVGNEMLDSEDVLNATCKFDEALALMKKYEKYQKVKPVQK